MMIKILAVVIPVIIALIIAIYNKVIPSSSEIKNIKIAQIGLTSDLLAINKHDNPEEYKNAIDNLQQEAYASLYGFLYRLDTIKLLQTTFDKTHALLVYKKYSNVLEHKKGGHITFKKMGPNLFGFLFFVTSIIFISAGSLIITGAEAEIDTTESKLTPGFIFSLVLWFEGLVVILIGIFIFFKGLDYVGSKSYIQKGLGCAMKINDDTPVVFKESNEQIKISGSDIDNKNEI